MPSITISTRLDAEEAALLESLAELSGLDRSTLVRSLVRRGMKDLRFEQAMAAFRREEVTLSRAAEIAGLDARDFIARMGDQGVDLHYDVEDLETDLAALAGER